MSITTYTKCTENFGKFVNIMKPVKKTNQGAKKKDLSNNGNNKKIPNYFQSQSIPIIGDNEIINEFQNTKPLYIKALKETLERRDVINKDGSNKIIEGLAAGQAEDGVNVLDNDQDDSFELDINQETNVLPECAPCLEKEKKYKDLMKVYLKLTHRYSELDQKYKDLLQTKTRTNQPEPDGTVSFSNDVFTPNEVKYLQAMPLDKTTDSTFILKCLEFAYKENPSQLRLRTLKGRPESVQYHDDGSIEEQVKKDPLSPIKVQRIKELFIDRLSKCKIDCVAFGERIKDTNVNKLFATGILNIVKKQK